MDVEKIKQNGLDIDFKAIAQRGDWTAEEQVIAKWYGIFNGAENEQGKTVRIAVQGGILSATQARGLAALANETGNGEVAFTTRHSAELHDVALASIPTVLDRLAELGLTTFHGSGDATRNLVRCPETKDCPRAVFDVTADCQATATLLHQSRDLDNLPRKYKVSFSGCSAGCAIPAFNCFGAVARLLNPDDPASPRGYQVYIGGGLGARPMKGKELFAFVPASQIAALARAVALFFRDHGDRSNRQRARLKFVVERLGINTCRRHILEYCAREGIDTSGFVVDLPGPQIKHPYSLPALMDELMEHGKAIPVRLPEGHVQATVLEELAELAETCADGHLYITLRQNLEFHDVVPAHLDQLLKTLERLGLDQRVGGLSDPVACPGKRHCPRGITTPGIAVHQLLPLLDSPRWREIERELRLHISGCPNGCAHPSIVDIGLTGCRLTTETGSEDGYVLWLGGSQERIGNKVGKFPLRELPKVIEAILERYRQRRSELGVSSLAEDIALHGDLAYIEGLRLQKQT